jgi:hypothetical protein
LVIGKEDHDINGVDQDVLVLAGDDFPKGHLSSMFITFTGFEQVVEFLFNIGIASKFLKSISGFIIFLVGAKAAWAFNGEEYQQKQLHKSQNRWNNPKETPIGNLAEVETSDLSEKNSEIEEQFEKTSKCATSSLG